jgi:hypothetical protein
MFTTSMFTTFEVVCAVLLALVILLAVMYWHDRVPGAKLNWIGWLAIVGRLGSVRK